MRRLFAVVGLSLFLALHASRFTLHDSAYASIPWLINYQGRLTDSGGKAVTGTFTVIFRFYDAATSGNKVWQEQQTVTIADADNGLFNAALGSVTPLTSLDFNSSYWLSVQVGSDTEMSPRQRLTSTGYAMNADTLGTLGSTKFLRTDVDTSTSGKLTITRSGTALVITPSSDPAADTKLIDVQNAAGTSKFSVDLEGDTVVAGDLSVTGTMSGATSTTGTTNSSWNIGSGTDATASNVSLLFGKSTGQKSLVFQGASTGDFIFSNNLRLDGQSALKLVASSGTNFVGLKAPSSISSSVTWTMPGADGSSGQVLTTNGSGTLSWAADANSGGTITGVTAGTGLTGGGTSGTVTLSLSTPVSVANGGTGASTLTSNGVLLGNTTSAISATSAGSANQVLRVPGAGGAPAFGTIDLTSSSAVTGALGATNGGTSQSTYTTGDLLYASAANTLSKLAIGSSGQFLKVSSGAPAWATLSNTDVSGLGTMATQNANNVAITGGTIDGTTIGGTTAGAGTFTTLTTTGTVTMGDGTGTDDVTIRTGTYTQSSATGALKVAQDTTAANSDGYLLLGRRSAKTGGWNVLQGRSSDGKLVWNGSALEVSGDSPASFTFGNSTSKVSLTYDPTNDMISFSKGTFSQQFRNLVKNSSFEAFSSLETFVTGSISCPVGVTCGGSGSTFQGGWGNFSPDEWVWDAGYVFQNAPVLFTPGTLITATTLQQEFIHGKSAVTIQDSNTAATNGPYNASTDATVAATLYPSASITDGQIEQTVTGLKPSTTYAVGAYMRRLSGTAECIVDITGEAGEGGTPSTTLGATLTANDTKLTVASQTDYNNFPNTGLLLITANGNTERISYTGKELSGAAYLLTSLIRQFDGSPSAADGSGNIASGTAVKLAPFQHLTTGTGAVTNFTLYKGQFVTKPTADDVKIRLIATGTTAGDQCRFDALQVVEGRSVPEYSASAIVDSGDQTLYGSLRLGRTANDRGGILSVDKALRARAVEFFTNDPGMSGQAGGFGYISPATKTAGPSTATLSTTGTYTGVDLVDVKVTIEAGGATFKWAQSTCSPSGCSAFSAPVTGLTVATSVGTATALGTTGIKVYFSSSPAVQATDEWIIHCAGASLASQYSSFSGTATYTSGQTKIYKDPTRGLMFQDGTVSVSLTDLTGSGISQPAHNSPRTFIPASGGGGTLDMQLNGTNTLAAGAANVEYWVEIQTDGVGGAADQFRWSVNSGSAWTGPTTITGAAQTLSNGITVTFSPSPYNAGNVGDRWVFTAYPPTASAAVKTLNAGNGINVTGAGDTRTIDVKPYATGPGLIADTTGVSLLRSCADSQILKWTTATSSWGCAADANSGGTGSVTSVSVTTANGVSGSVANATTTPAITLTLGAITPTTVNKVTLTAPATGSTLTIAEGKTLTASNSLTLAGTDSTTMTFPGTSDTVVTLGATQTLTSKTLTTPTVSGNITYTGTQPKRTIVLTASGAIVPASNAPQQLQTNGTNLSFYTLNYSGTAASAQSAYWEFIVPDSYTGTTVNATLYWLTPSTTTGNVVKWFVDMNGLNNAQTLDAALQTAGTVTGNPTGTANQVLVTTEITGITTGWSAGSYAVVRVQRNAADAADTETALAKLLMVKLKWTGSAESD